MLFLPDAKKDTSYFKYDGSLYELLDFYQDSFDDDIGSNFVIKAITKCDDGIQKYDVNNDGSFSLSDIILTGRYLLGMLPFSRNQLYTADINSNSTISLSDIVLMQRHFFNA